jgi:hypothetical protein
MIVLPPEPVAAIHWECSTCHDEGVISHWDDSPDDLRRRTLTRPCPLNEIAITDEVASALRDLRLLDADSERVVTPMRADGERIVLAANDELDELIGLVAGSSTPSGCDRCGQPSSLNARSSVVTSMFVQVRPSATSTPRRSCVGFRVRV